jgi:acetylornithine deacetylase/succinyl-diaminopimelate desuccinylase-like protein
MLVILDGPRHISNKPTLTFGARGITTVTLKTFGPRVPQHSGHYGNYTPNPVFKMAKLLAGLKDDNGKVTLPGYYDGVIIDENTMGILKQVPDDENEIMKNQGIAEIDEVGKTYQEALQYPSLNIRGINAGWVGDEVRTIIPATATAEIDIRLVKESNSDRLVGLLKDYIEGQGYYFVDVEPTDEERENYPKLISMTSEHSYSAFRTSYDSDVGVWLNSALTRAFGEEPIRIRTSGGSIPIAPFVSTLNIPAVTVPTVNRDNNQHSPNENIRLGNLYEGIITCLAILTEKMK